MAQETKAVLKTYFQTGDIPTQGQFENFIESYENLKDGNLLDGSEDGITAFAGGGQAGAYQLTKKVSNVVTVAAPNDSVKLDSATIGKMMWVRNSGANDLDVFPALGDEIAGGGINTPDTLVPTRTRFYICVKPTKWSATNMS